MSTDAEVFDPSAKPLNDQELKIAIRDNVCEHREFVKAQVDPALSDQEVAILAYKFLEAPLMLPDNELFYGWVKVRGAHNNWESAQKYSEQILKYHDSKNKNRIVKMGVWVPLSSSKLLTKETVTVAESEWQKEQIKGLEREKEMIKEIRDREEKLKQGIDQFEENSLDYYIMKKVTLAENQHTLERAMDTVKNCRKNLNTLVPEIEKMEKEHPEYVEEALPKYNKERVEAGLESVTSFEK